jgi:hypothetical protein
MNFYLFKILSENIFLIYLSLFYMKIWPKMNIDLSWPCNIFLTWWVFYMIVYLLFINWLIDTMGYGGVSAVPVSKWKKNVSLSEWVFLAVGLSTCGSQRSTAIDDLYITCFIYALFFFGREKVAPRHLFLSRLASYFYKNIY